MSGPSESEIGSQSHRNEPDPDAHHPSEGCAESVRPLLIWRPAALRKEKLSA